MLGSRTSDYDFDLPEDRIAQSPADKRDESRLMVVDRNSGDIEHRKFRDIAGIIPSGDAIVVNTTKVFRARLLGTRDSGAPAEILLLKSIGANRYEAMVHPGGKLKAGRRVHVSPELDVEILETTDRRTRIVQLHSTIPVDDAIERYGHIPLPPYIRRGDEASDAERYQTVYASESGSVAAPTAGLHFTREILDSLAMKGVARADVVLHVGAGTFKPVEVDDPARHVMHEESYWIPGAAASALNATRARDGRIWAVGTTSVRTLESAVGGDGRFVESSGETRIFIRPPYHFKAVDHLITNFHLPRSTLLMLVAAFAGYELIMKAYREAMSGGYRFYSYGDAMLIV
ncbi:MAG TPA: tRNA preQ1(34) S-adenosylmethionine ribosyltransferase-isomerase QueA [Gemmatimonadaceae bacterium]